MANIIIFSVISLIIFIYTVVKLIKENNSNYLFALIPEFIGIIINFICIFFKIEPNAILLIIMYILSVLIPILLLILERKNIKLFEILNIVKANYYNKKGNKELAKKYLSKNVKDFPNNYLGHEKLGEWYEKNNELEKAENEYLKAIELKPVKYENYYKLATVYNRDKKIENAISILREVLKRKPDYLDASICLGGTLYNAEMYKEAINVFQNALKYNPGEYKLYYYMGMTYTRLNDFQNAKDYYKKAATINSVLNVAKLNLGQIALIFKDYEEAEKYFMECIENDDEELQADAYYYLAKIKLINNEISLAIQYANIAIEIEPKLLGRMEKDTYFSSILGKLKFVEDKDVKTKLSDADRQIINHLDNTYGVVQTLISDNVLTQKEKTEKERE